VLDDLTPDYAGPDPVRELWLGNDRSLRPKSWTPTTAAIVATLPSA